MQTNLLHRLVLVAVGSRHVLGFRPLFSLLFLFVGWQSHGNTQPAFVRAHPFYLPFAQNDQLPNKVVYDVLYDSKGFMWLAGEDGLYRFDGVNFKLYSHPKQSSLPGSNIIEDPYGRIWYRNFDGYYFYVENDSLNILPQQDPAGYYPACMTEKHVMQVQEDYLAFYDLKRLEIVKRMKFSPFKIGQSIATHSQFYTTIGFQVYPINEKLNKEAGIPSPITKGQAMFFTYGDMLFMVEKYNELQTIYKLVNGRFEAWKDLAVDAQIHGINLIDNHIFVCTSNGVFVLHPDSPYWQHLFEGIPIGKAVLNPMGEWLFCTLGKGILIVPNLKRGFRPLPLKPSDIGFYQQGAAFLGNSSNEIYKLDVNSLEFNKVHQGSIDKMIRKLIWSDKGPYVSSIEGDFALYNANTWACIQKLPYAIKDAVQLDSKYFALAASSSLYLYQLPNTENIKSVWDDAFLSGTLYNLHRTSIITGVMRLKTVVYNEQKQQLYYAGNKGVWIKSPQQTSELLLQGNRIYADQLLLVQGQLWIKTTKGEILTYNENKGIITIPTLALAGAKAYSIKGLGSHLYWIGANAIYRTPLNNPTQSELFFTLKEAKDWVLDLFEENNNIMALGKDGILDLSHYDLPNKQASKTLFGIYKVETNGEQVHFNDKWEFGHRVNFIKLHFFHIPGVLESRHKILYAINGSHWQELDPNSRFILLNKLEPGQYKVEFRSERSQIPLQTLEFSIKKPVWKTMGFLALIMVALLSLSYLIYDWRLTQLKNRNALLVEKVQLEQALNKSVLASIKSQMNPHFIYNALNAIQSFIFIKENDNAMHYLRQFSKLTRMVLEMSEKDTVQLKEEAEALKLYLSLEKMRFGDEFHYDILLERVHTQDVYLPAMLIQPYVENAVKHGLGHLKGAKRLKVIFELQGQVLKVIIDDNGIGRKRAGEIQEKKPGKHQSFATQANAKRLSILNKGNASALGIKYIDKEDALGNPLGTVVVLHIPVKNEAWNILQLS